ncbi:MAG TPA: hypothetical protein VK987_02250 [Anaerolineae bacterium]|nr:hypothetical protein [Anaerolineae bacterium]
MERTPPSTRPHPARRPVLGLVAEILGLVGVAVGILGIGGLWLIQGSIDAGIADGLIAARAAVERAAVKADEAAERLEARALDVDEVAAEVLSLAGMPDPTAEVIAAVADRLSGVADRYVETRDWYVDVRDQALGVLDVLDWIDSVVPSIDLPDGPRELLVAIDGGVQELDAAVTSLSQAGSTRIGLTDTAGTIAQTADEISSGLREAADVARRADEALLALSETLARAAERLTALLGLVVAVASLVLLYGIVLHLALWALGRRWRAPDPEA